MCGVAGSVNFSFDPAVVNKVMGHRGPDERASYRDGNVLLHHLRLSIVDVAGGHQPMHLGERYTIIFNGEIYNHLEVRQQLNLNCETKSDTETILQAWHARGTDMLRFFDGMFVFVIYDAHEKKLSIARDRAGKKPFYYYHDGQTFVFASELVALRTLLPLQLNDQHIAAYLRLGSLFRAQTPYHKVFELESGSWMTLDTQTLAIQTERWWNIGGFYQKPVLNISEADALAELDLKLQAGVKRRLESSDLEVGSFLSGGIDSGLVTAMAARLHPRLKTFTVSFDGTFDEAPLARQVADKYGTTHEEIHISFDHLLQDIEGIIAQYGEPFFDNSAIPSRYVSAAASKHLTVVLNGDGADELFGGYRRQVPFAKYNFFHSPAAVNAAAKMLTQVLPVGHNKMSKYTYLYRLLSFAGKNGPSKYLASWVDIFEGFEDRILVPEEHYLQPYKSLFDDIVSTPVNGLRQMMWLDFEVSLFDALLVKMDIATMAHSLEGRSPMLCKELLEWAPQLPDELKIKGTTTKYLLRKLAEKYLPPAFVGQPKRGFEVPLKHWVNNELKDIIQAYLNRADRYFPTIVDQKFVDELMLGKLKMSGEKRAKIIWSLFCLEVWYHKCVKQE